MNTSFLNSKVRVDAKEKVQGKAQYGADINIDKALNISVVRSSKHHARIISINTEEAENSEGVVKVITAEDIPGDKFFGPVTIDKPVLAYDVVRQIGDPIVLVVAESKEMAEQAARKVVINYKELEAVFDPVKALLPSAPRIHPDGNLYVSFDLSKGDVQKGIEESDVIVERRFHVHRTAPGYLEPEVASAEFQENGVLKVWSNSQMPFEVQEDISKVLVIPKHKVQVVVPAIGGSFGGKSDSTISLLAALAAFCVKGTVRIVNSREESMVAHPKKHPGVMHYKMGAKKDGTFTFLVADMVYDTGAYASYGSAVGAISAEHSTGPYRTPNVSVTSKVAYTNTPFGGTVRGPGGVQANFPCESMVDIIAYELGIDPIEIRLKNLWQKGDETYLGLKIDKQPSIEECLLLAKEAREKLKTRPTTKGKLQGIGISSSLLKVGMGFGVPDDSFTAVEWMPDGRVKVWVGAPDLGQGLKTISLQIVAEVLGLPMERMILAPIDTTKSPKSGPTNTSRSTMLMGNSLVASSKLAIANLLDFTADELIIDRNKLTYKNGKICFDSPNGEHIHLVEILERADQKGIVLKGEGISSFPVPRNVPKGLPVGLPHVKYCFGAHVVRVEVDPDFNKVEVKDYVAIHDVGKAINPMSVEGQIEGAVMMGLGYTLMEEMPLRPNNTWVDNLTEYLLPTIADVPEITSIIVEDEDADGPFGAIGVGEPAGVAVAPAIANAIFNATGMRVLDLPITPERLTATKGSN